MVLSDVSVKRPVFAAVMSIMLVAFGIISFTRLPLRELPNMEVPIVSVGTSYIGASAEVIENRITRIIEEQIAGIEGIDHITSSSRNESSSITDFFKISRDIDAAASDVRDAVSRVASRLPQEADSPRVSRMDGDAFPIMWFSLASDRLSAMEIADYAKRYIVDRFSVLEGVAQVQWSKDSLASMRIWLNRVALAARGLTVSDVERALRAENVELPAGTIESSQRDFAVRITRAYSTEEDFRDLVVGEGSDGHLIRLSEVARVEVAPTSVKLMFRGNGLPQVGIGIVKQSNANALDVSRAVNEESERVRLSLPEGMILSITYDSTVYVDRAINEVFRTLGIATAFVVLVIWTFLGSLRAAIVPAVVVPICLTATFGALGVFDYSINLMTLLGLVLCIGLVVDDSIVVLENIQRRVDAGEPPVLASYRGARQVAFAVIATTLVIVAVFAPLVFVEGFVGRIFGELGVTVTAAVCISSFVALSLSPMMCSKLLKSKNERSGGARRVLNGFNRVRAFYLRILRKILPHPIISAAVLVVVLGGIVFLWGILPQELAPDEDRFIVNVNITGPEGANFDYMVKQANQLEDILIGYVESGEVERVTIRVPGGWGNVRTMNTGNGMVVLKEWGERPRSGKELARELGGRISQIPGVRGFASMSQGMAMGWGRPVQLVISGPGYDQVEEWANIIADRARNYPGLVRVDTDYKPNKPQFKVVPNRMRAADLGVSIQTIGQTLETCLGSRRVTRYLDRGEEYDVWLQCREEDRQQPTDLSNIFVRSDRSAKLIPLSNLVTIEEQAASPQRKRWNRLQSIIVSADLAPGYNMGEALDFLDNVVKDDLESQPRVDYSGDSRQFKEQGSALLFAFGMALLIVFLVLAAQFESFIHPFVIMLTVPVAIVGGLIGLWIIDSSVNIYSQIGLIILVGIAAKNGILIVEFTNQLRDQGKKFEDALMEAAEIRFRPIVMTGLSTAAGSIPLVLATGPGASSRLTIGVVIFLGVLFSTLMTLIIVPVFYRLFAYRTGSPGRIARMLADYEHDEGRAQGTIQPSPAE